MRNYISSICNEAVDTISNIGFGNTVPHDVLENMLRLSRDKEKEKYYALVNKVRKILIWDKGIFLKTIPKKGYLLVPPGGEIDLCKGEFVRGQKTIKRSVAKTVCIRIDRMSEQDRNRTIEEAQRMANLATFIGFVRESKKIA